MCQMALRHPVLWTIKQQQAFDWKKPGREDGDGGEIIHEETANYLTPHTKEEIRATKTSLPFNLLHYAQHNKKTKQKIWMLR